MDSEEKKSSHFYRSVPMFGKKLSHTETTYVIRDLSNRDVWGRRGGSSQSEWQRGKESKKINSDKIVNLVKISKYTKKTKHSHTVGMWCIISFVKC